MSTEKETAIAAHEAASQKLRHAQAANSAAWEKMAETGNWDSAELVALQAAVDAASKAVDAAYAAIPSFDVFEAWQ